MLFVIAGIGIAAAIKWVVNDVPAKAVEVKRMSVELEKAKVHGAAVNRVFVEDVFISKEDAAKIQKCPSGCGTIIREGVERIQTIAPQLVAVGELHQCPECKKYSAA